MASPFSRTLRSLEADDARPSRAGWAVAGVLALAWLVWFAAARVGVVERSQAARLELLAAAHPVAARQGGALAWSTMALGRAVRAGEVLLELDTRSAALRIGEENQRLRAVPMRRAATVAELEALEASARSEQASAQAAVRAAQARAGEAAAQLAFARDYERRLASEVRGGGVAEVDLLRARSEAQRQAALLEALSAEQDRHSLEAQARISQLRARVEALRGQIAALDGEAATLVATVARLEAEIERARVRAPVDGTLAEVATLRPGAWVSEGQQLATVLPSGRLRVVAEFAPATALGRVAAGQSARVLLDGFPWAQHGSLQARVQQVAGELRDRRLRAELELDVASVPPGLVLQHGLSGTVEVALEQATPAQLLWRGIGRRLDLSTSTEPRR